MIKIMVALIIIVTAGFIIFKPSALFASAPFLIFLACPLMHVFMMGGHNHKEHDDKKS